MEAGARDLPGTVNRGPRQRGRNYLGPSERTGNPSSLVGLKAAQRTQAGRLGVKPRTTEREAHENRDWLAHL